MKKQEQLGETINSNKLGTNLNMTGKALNKLSIFIDD